MPVRCGDGEAPGLPQPRAAATARQLVPDGVVGLDACAPRPSAAPPMGGERGARSARSTRRTASSRAAHLLLVLGDQDDAAPRGPRRRPRTASAATGPVPGDALDRPTERDDGLADPPCAPTSCSVVDDGCPGSVQCVEPLRNLRIHRNHGVQQQRHRGNTTTSPCTCRPPSVNRSTRSTSSRSSPIVTRTDRRTRTCAHRHADNPSLGGKPPSHPGTPNPGLRAAVPPGRGHKRRGTREAQAP